MSTPGVEDGETRGTDNRTKESRLSRFIRLIHPLDDEQVREETKVKFPEQEGQVAGKDRALMTRGGKQDDGKGHLRSERWFEDIEQQVDENTKTTQENRTLLSVIDERTAIMMRLLFAVVIALVVSIGAGIAVSLLF